ncbi:nucleolar zinc-finger protein [Mactra antiquata]
MHRGFRMDVYPLSLMVTFDQEMAIQSLFEHRGWSFNKLKMQNFGKDKSVKEEINAKYSGQISHYINYVQQLPYTGEQFNRSITKHGSKSYHNLDNSCASKSISENSFCLNSLSKLQSTSKISPNMSIERCTPVDSQENCKRESVEYFPSTVNYVLPYILKAFSLNMDEDSIKEKISEIVNSAFAGNKFFTYPVEKNSNLNTTPTYSGNAIEVVADKTEKKALVDSKESSLNKNLSSDELWKNCTDELDIDSTVVNNECMIIEDESNVQQAVSFDVARNDILKKELSDVKDDTFSSHSVEEPNACHIVKLEQSRDGKKSGKSFKNKISKLHWTVSKNLRMHRYHRKCRTKPCDLTEDMYSPSENGYYCPDCQFIFFRKHKLILHKVLKKGYCLPGCIYCDADDEHKEVYQCKKCPKCFQTQEMLERHLKKHCKKRFCCNICGTLFYMVTELKAHTQNEHSDSVQPEHLCDLCGSKFKEKKVLNSHVKYVHSDNRSEICSYCDKSFKTKSQLKSHLVTHKSISELNLSCEICGKGFSRKATLKEHVRRHRKEFSFFCSVCEKGFYRQYDLEDHMRVHTKDKPFGCKLCDFKCSLSCNLAKHMKIHIKQGLKNGSKV